MTATELNAHLTSLPNKHALVTKHSKKRKKITPWFTPEFLVAKRECRRTKQTWRKSGLTVRKEIFTQTKNAVTRLVLKAKTDYLNAQVAESQTCKQLFSVTNSLLGKSKVSPLPTNIPAAQLPHSFCEFFTEKIKQIRQNLDNSPYPYVSTVVPDIATALVQFSPVSEKEVHNILKKTAQKTCKLDPLPTSLFYENIDVLPVLMNIINRLLLSGEVPSEFKTAVVKPLLKKASFDPNQMKNLSPSLESSISIKDPRKSCPDAAHKSSDFQLSHTQISISLPSWSQYRNSSPSFCQ